MVYSFICKTLKPNSSKYHTNVFGLLYLVCLLDDLSKLHIRKIMFSIKKKIIIVTIQINWLEIHQVARHIRLKKYKLLNFMEFNIIL